VISKRRIGFDSTDCEAAAEMGKNEFNTPGVFTDPVAGNVLSYIQAFAR